MFQIVTYYNSFSIPEYSGHNFTSTRNDTKFSWRLRNCMFPGHSLHLAFGIKAMKAIRNRDICLDSHCTGRANPSYQADLPSERQTTIRGIDLTDNFLINTFLENIECSLSVEMTLLIVNSTIKLTVSRRRFITNLWTFLTDSSFTDVDEPLQQCMSSQEVLPGLSSAFRFVTVQ